MEEGYKPCPYCAEPVRIEAVICRHCNRKLTQGTPAWRWVLYGILGAAVIGLVIFALMRAPQSKRENQKSVEDMAKTGVPGEGRAMSPSEIFDTYSGSVVLMQNYNEDNQLVATGSGFCVGNSLVATNYHVIRGATRLVAKARNSMSFDASGVESYDLEKDLAVLKFQSMHLKPIPMGDPAGMKRGDHVVAIGAPLGIQNTVSDGLITNLVAVGGVNVLQTSAPISHGSSGGPLLNDRGAVVGITAATRPEGELVNFAVSSVYLKQLLEMPSPVSLAEFLSRTKTVTHVLEGSLNVREGTAVPLAFAVPPNHVAVLEGSFNISGGGGNDIYWGLLEASPTGQPIAIIPPDRYARQSAIKRSLPAGRYALVFDNKFSTFSSKTITGSVTLTDFR